MRGFGEFDVDLDDDDDDDFSGTILWQVRYTNLEPAICSAKLWISYCSYTPPLYVVFVATAESLRQDCF